MARYRSKDEVDLRWNQIRRRITKELDVQIANWREAALNHLLGEAWTEYARGLESGEVRVLEPVYSQFVKDALDESIDTDMPSSDEADVDAA